MPKYKMTNLLLQTQQKQSSVFDIFVPFDSDYTETAGTAQHFLDADLLQPEQNFACEISREFFVLGMLRIFSLNTFAYMFKSSHIQREMSKYNKINQNV